MEAPDRLKVPVTKESAFHARRLFFWRPCLHPGNARLRGPDPVFGLCPYGPGPGHYLGQMGVINMAHGEFMILGAYVTAMTSHVFAEYIPGLFSTYFFLAIALAFLASGALGMVVEQVIIRHLYRRPLDTLLATRGLSLI